MINALTSVGFGLAISAALIYVLLRFFVAAPNATNTTEAISRHAFWTALIAFLASGTSGLSNLWAIDPETHTGIIVDGQPVLLMHAAAPGLWLTLVYILGQFTWPRHLKPVRSASLEVRSVKTLVPKFLAGLLLVCTVISTVAIIFAWNDPGAPHREGNDSSSQEMSYNGETDDFGNPVDDDGNPIDLDSTDAEGNVPYISSITGTRSGNEVGPYLMGGLALALLGSAGAAAVIVRRPPLDALDAGENSILRSVWINRLLRTASIVVAGFGAASASYLAEGIRARGDWAVPIAAGGPFFSESAQNHANALSLISGFGFLLLIVVVVSCSPPKLVDVSPIALAGSSAPSRSFSTARDFLLLIHGIGLFVMFLVVMFLGLQAEGASYSTTTSADGTQTFSFDSTDPTRLQTMGNLALAIALAAGSYLLLNLLAAWVISRRVGGQSLETPRRGLLPGWFLTVLALATTVGVTSVINFAVAGPPALREIVWWAAAVLVIVAALAGALYRNATHRARLADASRSEDTKIRLLLAQRGARMVGGVSLLLTSLLADPTFWTPSGPGYGEGMYYDQDPSGFQLITLALGIILCLLPAATIYRAPRPITQYSTPSNH
ncbi:hypothetical protein [Paeniglutamicibacter sp. Y32M11]|uniref:hypothetical protein n=1 Tax=Paeniglutamicibacter sp. Y32M11 TaxID=2853258 RepID=UPI001C533B3F|nr:hypothetical protein [Paeniglutamicibacter sp. Y32M11]QXQ09314.1 hypothetical protein KUF55_12520 [Paeniglutamicibacter sp. Y32M11]